MGFLLNSRFNEPYHLGGSTSSLAKHVADCALGGHAYRINWASEIPLRHSSVPLMRQQQDTSERPGEHSINPEGLWRRVGDSWHLGAGQEMFDHPDSSPFRFNDSKGMDIWTKNKISLLPSVDEKLTNASNNLQLAVAGTHLYAITGNALQFTTDILPDTPAFTQLTGEPATNPTSIVSDGFNVWTAHGADGIYKTTRGAATTSSHITGAVSKLAYVKNRVLAANASSIYDISALAFGSTPGALPSPYFTHGNTDFQWIGFAESQSHIYAAGFSGDKSLIYSIAIKEDGTALDAPIVAGQLPDGEVVTAIFGYLGRFMAIGSQKGWRFALVSESGGLSIGSLVETPAPVEAFEGQEEFIWYGLSSFLSASSGLGRFSTAAFSDPASLVPAYASDLMVDTSTNPVTSIVTFNGLRVFAINQIGIYAEHPTDKVADGWLTTGNITYGLTEPKSVLFVDVAHDGDAGIDGYTEVELGNSGEDFVSLGVHEAHQAPHLLATWATGEADGSYFELRLRIFRDTTDLTKFFTINYWLMRAQPRPWLTNIIIATVLIAPIVESLVDTEIFYETIEEVNFLEALNNTKQVTTWQEAGRAYAVILDDFEVNVRSITEGIQANIGFNADATLKMKRVI